jgi:hypothetical protein
VCKGKARQLHCHPPPPHALTLYGVRMLCCIACMAMAPYPPPLSSVFTLFQPQLSCCGVFHPHSRHQVPVSNYSLRVSIHYMLFGETTASELQHIAETVVPVAGAMCVALLVSDVSMVRVCRS